MSGILIQTQTVIIMTNCYMYVTLIGNPKARVARTHTSLSHDDKFRLIRGKCKGDIRRNKRLHLHKFKCETCCLCCQKIKY